MASRSLSTGARSQGFISAASPPPRLPSKAPSPGWNGAAVPGEPNEGRDLDHAEGAITAISDSGITLTTPYAGTLTIPRDRLARLHVLDRGWLRIIDPSAHHLGDNISTTPPLLDPPLPEGGVLEAELRARRPPSRASLRGP